jgi:hypothetical protein
LLTSSFVNAQASRWTEEKAESWYEQQSWLVGSIYGKTQTYYPWDSWRHPYILDQPTVWFHEVLHPDGKPYRDAEVKLIRELTRRASPNA